MATNTAHDMVRGRTIRFSWTEGPTKGSAQDHVFHEDGTVEWRSAGEGQGGGSSTSNDADMKQQAPERPRYSSVEVMRDFWQVSYLANSGYTLTVLLNFEDRSMVGVASNDKNWYELRGRFEVLS